MLLNSIPTDNQLATTIHRTALSISPWVNEPLPPLTELLSAHDVARLMRRPSWVLVGLSLIGRFPRKLRFRGRRIAWRRSEIFEWLASEVTATGNECADHRHASIKFPSQPSLPFGRTSHRSVDACNSGRATSRGR